MASTIPADHEIVATLRFVHIDVVPSWGRQFNKVIDWVFMFAPMPGDVRSKTDIALCPLCPCMQTSLDTSLMPAKCQMQTFTSFVGAHP
jgi:hypothetical protein